jgi:multiple sugar transport system substrate-binding protein
MARRTRRKTLAAIAALPMIVALAACSGGGGATSTSAGGSTEVTVLDAFQSEPGNTTLQNMLEACATPLGLTINRQTVPPASLVQKTLQLASSKTMPDLLNIDNPDMPQFAAIGALTPLSDIGVDTSGYYPGMIGAGSYQDKVYGIPQTGNTVVLSYNKDMLAAAGLTPPTTWDELRADAKALTHDDVYGFAMAAAPSYEGTWQLMPYIWSNGGDETNINTPETVQALQLISDLVKDGSISQSAVNWGQPDALNAFIAGKAAMVENGIWTFGQLDSTPGLNYGSVVLPVPKAGDPSIVPLGGKVWTIPQTGDTAREKNAAKILDCLNSDANQTANIGSGGSVASKIAVADAFSASNVDPHAAFEQLAISNSRARAAKLGADWPATAKALYQAEQLVFTGQASPADALKQEAESLGK